MAVVEGPLLLLVPAERVQELARRQAGVSAARWRHCVDWEQGRERLHRIPDMASSLVVDVYLDCLFAILGKQFLGDFLNSV